MKMDAKTLFVGLAAVVLIAAVVVLAQPASAGLPASAMDRIVSEGKIKACFIVYPPMVVKDPNSGSLSGEMIDALEYIAAEAQLKIEYSETSWSTFAAALHSKQCDVVATGLFNKISRAKSVAFTRPLFYIGNSALVRASETRFKQLSDFNRTGVKIAVLSGEVGHLYAQKHLPAAELIVLQGGDITLALQQVSSGRADAAFTDGWTIEQYARAHSETVDFLSINPKAAYGLNPVAWAVRQEDAALLTFLNNAFDELDANGKFVEWEANYGVHWFRQPFELVRS